jgi:hypothetical protein
MTRLSDPVAAAFGCNFPERRLRTIRRGSFRVADDYCKFDYAKIRSQSCEGSKCPSREKSKCHARHLGVGNSRREAAK